MYRVCIADDEAYVRQSIVQRIENAGIPVIVAGTAEDGESAGILYDNEKPDLFFVDIRMPGKDGLTFIEEVRQKEPDTRTKFIIISGYDDFAYMQKAIKVGVADYIKKPFQQDEFEEMLRCVCQRIDEENLKENSMKRGSRENYWESFYHRHKREKAAGTFLLLYKKKIRRREWMERAECICNPDKWLYLWFHGIENVLMLYCSDVDGQQETARRLNQELRCYVIRESGNNISLQEMILNMDAGLGRRFYTRMPCLLENESEYMYQKTKHAEFGAALENTKQNYYSGCIEEAMEEAYAKKEQCGYVSSVFQALITEIADQYIRHGRPLPNDLRQEFLPMAAAKYDTREELKGALDEYAQKLNQELVRLEGRKDVMERIIQYINLHYMDDISLGSLACESFWHSCAQTMHPLPVLTEQSLG